ncbi:MAG: flagellar export chaperone FliS [Phycisphaerales bacterium]
MAIDVNNPYFRTKVLTASQEELRLLLIDGCLRFLRQGREALAAAQWEQVYTSLSSAKDIILELLSALNPEVAPDLTSKLSSLYTWMLMTTTEASFKRDPEKLDAVIQTMEYERETWVMLMEKIAKERPNAGANANPGTTAAPAPGNPGAPPQQRRPLSISA